MACEKLGTSLGNLANVYAPYLLVVILAASQGESAENRLNAFGFLSLTSFVLYTLGMIDDSTFDTPSLAQGYDDFDNGTDLIGSVFDLQFIPDIAVAVLLAVQAIGVYKLDASVWSIVAGIAAVWHLPGLLVGDLVATSVVMSAVLATGLLDGVGASVAELTEGLPDAVSVRAPATHQVLGVVSLLIVMLVDPTDESDKFEDVIQEPVIIAGLLGVFCAIGLRMENVGVALSQLLLAGFAVSSTFAMHYSGDEIVDRSNVTLVDFAAASGDDMLLNCAGTRAGTVTADKFFVVTGANLLVAALVMAMAEYTEKHFSVDKSVAPAVTSFITGQSATRGHYEKDGDRTAADEEDGKRDVCGTELKPASVGTAGAIGALP